MLCGGEVVQVLNPLDTLTVVEVPVDLSCMMVHTLELEPVKLVLDMVDRTVDPGWLRTQRRFHHYHSTEWNKCSSTRWWWRWICCWTTAGQYGGRPGGSGGAGGCGHNNQGNGSAGGGQAPGADLNNGSGGTGCNQAGGGAGPGSNGYDARPYGYDDQNLNLPGIAPHQGYFCAGGGNTRAPGTGTPGTGNGFTAQTMEDMVLLVKVGSASGYVDKTFNQSFDTEGNH